MPWPQFRNPSCVSTSVSSAILLRPAVELRPHPLRRVDAGERPGDDLALRGVVQRDARGAFRRLHHDAAEPAPAAPSTPRPCTRAQRDLRVLRGLRQVVHELVVAELLVGHVLEIDLEAFAASTRRRGPDRRWSPGSGPRDRVACSTLSPPARAASHESLVGELELLHRHLTPDSRRAAGRCTWWGTPPGRSTAGPAGRWCRAA